MHFSLPEVENISFILDLDCLSLEIAERLHLPLEQTSPSEPDFQMKWVRRFRELSGEYILDGVKSNYSVYRCVEGITLVGPQFQLHLYKEGQSRLFYTELEDSLFYWASLALSWTLKQVLSQEGFVYIPGYRVKEEPQTILCGERFSALGKWNGENKFETLSPEYLFFKRNTLYGIPSLIRHFEDNLLWRGTYSKEPFNINAFCNVRLCRGKNSVKQQASFTDSEKWIRHVLASTREVWLEEEIERNLVNLESILKSVKMMFVDLPDEAQIEKPLLR